MLPVRVFLAAFVIFFVGGVVIALGMFLAVAAFLDADPRPTSQPLPGRRAARGTG
jgi:hypothetical protein